MLYADFNLRPLLKEFDYELVEVILPIAITLLYKEVENQIGRDKKTICDLLKVTPYPIMEAFRLLDPQALLADRFALTHKHDTYTEECVTCLEIDEWVSKAKLLLTAIIDSLQFNQVVFDYSKMFTILEVIFLDDFTILISGERK